MEDNISDLVVVPDDAGDRLRASLGLRPSETPRIAFIAGPGDVAGTFDYWMEGRFDPRTPVVAYSTMFYTLVEKLEAMALVIAEPEKLPRHRDPRFRFVSVPRARPPGRIAYRKAGLAFSWKVLRELRKYEPHIVLLGVDTPWLLIASIPKNTRIILTAHTNFWPMGLKPVSLKARIKHQIASVLMHRVSAGVCTSEETRRQVIEIRRDLIGSLYTEVPQVLSRFLKPPRQLERLRNILFLGRLQEEKGVYDLLSAFEKAACRHPDLTLSFAGKGEADDGLRQRIAASPVRNQIRMLGQLDAQEVHQQLERADVLVCPTRSNLPEGLALVVVEAAVHAVPAVLSSVVPAKELVENACIEFPADNIEALASALMMLADDAGKLHELQERLAVDREKFFDRSLSWGSQLYSAFVT